MPGLLTVTQILASSVTGSERVTRCLKGIGHDLVVADANVAGPNYCKRNRKLRTIGRELRPTSVW
jgi:hypothetical protein